MGQFLPFERRSDHGGSGIESGRQVQVKIYRLRVAKSRCRVVWYIMPRPCPKPRLDLSTTCREKAYAELH
jgi:hypothetical protein